MNNIFRLRGARIGFPTSVIFLVCLLLEAVLTASDYGLVGATSWRMDAFSYGAFWVGLLTGWDPVFPAQHLVMFITYGFLHGGVIHFGVNMLTLNSLAQPIIVRVGSGQFAGLYAASLIGGGVGFALLTEPGPPMIGASGALFGLVGALIAWGYRDRRRLKLALWPVYRAILILIAINIVLGAALSGQLAWQTHLGGFVTGVLTSIFLGRVRGQQ